MLPIYELVSVPSGLGVLDEPGFNTLLSVCLLHITHMIYTYRHVLDGSSAYGLQHVTESESLRPEGTSSLTAWPLNTTQPPPGPAQQPELGQSVTALSTFNCCVPEAANGRTEALQYPRPLRWQALSEVCPEGVYLMLLVRIL